MKSSNCGCYMLLCKVQLLNVATDFLNHCFTLLSLGLYFSNLVHKFLHTKGNKLVSERVSTDDQASLREQKIVKPPDIPQC